MIEQTCHIKFMQSGLQPGGSAIVSQKNGLEMGSAFHVIG
jgi:hypothetical protein